MKFETLIRFFPSIDFDIKLTKEVKGTILKVSNLSKNEITIVVMEEENNITKQVSYFGKVSETHAKKIQGILDSSNFNIGKIISNDNNTLHVRLVKINKIKVSNPIEVGLGSKVNMSLDLFKKLFEKSYLINIDGRDCYIYGRHNKSNDKSFSIISETKKYDVLLEKRQNLGSSDNPNLEEEVWSINSDSQPIKVEDYIYELAYNNLNFKSYSEVEKASTEAIIENISHKDYGIIGKWEMFSKEDYECSCRISHEVGQIPYDNLSVEGNKYIFVVNDLIALDRLKKALFELESLDLAVYKDNVKFSSIVHLDYIRDTMVYTTYDGNYIIKNSGFLAVSNMGNERIYERRQLAFDRIKEGKAAKPNLIELIEGKASPKGSVFNRVNIYDYKKEIHESFGKFEPNKNQLKAIEMALNTPDFTIIQGPPGCGKTSVIDAINKCLLKDDSGEYRYASTVATAYQRGATKRMVENKKINGLPIPFISNPRDREYMEDTYQEYIAEVRDKLKAKYPELVAIVNNKNALESIADFESRFDPLTASIDKTATLLMNMKPFLNEELEPDELNKYNELLNDANTLIKRLLTINFDLRLYYARLIPYDEASFSDDGLNVFYRSKATLQIINNEIATALDRLEDEFNEDIINFKKVKSYRNQIIYYLKNDVKVNINKDFNQRASKEISEIKEALKNRAITSEKDILLEYIDTFMNNPLRVRYSIQDWVNTISATHQIAGDPFTITGKRDLKENIYDNVLIDEAARSCPPDLIIPLSCAKNKIIMVGDQRQLPQFVSDEILNNLIIDEKDKRLLKETSVFEYLIDTTKNLTFEDRIPRFIALDEQYRMPKVLGDFIGRIYYDDLNLKSPLGNPCDNPRFIQKMPHIEDKCMVFYDLPNARENASGYQNEVEANAIVSLLKEFLASKENGNEKLSIGVLSFYRAQINLIKHLLSNDVTDSERGYMIKDEYKDRLMIDTVDSFQGLENDIIILSMVRSNPLNKFKKGSLYGFLKDERRLCVALSRAKRCVVVVGNGKGMLQSETAEKQVRGLYEFYKQCKDGGDYVARIEKL